MAFRSLRLGLGGGGGGRLGVKRLLASGRAGPLAAEPLGVGLVLVEPLVEREEGGEPPLSALAARTRAVASFWNLNERYRSQAAKARKGRPAR